MVRGNKLHLLLFSLVIFAFVGAAFAQDITGSIVGTVTDSSGAAVPGAKVIVTNTGQNAVVRTLDTDGNGFFSAPRLNVGTYSVSVEAKGFKRSVQTNITLNANDSLTTNLKLEVGNVTQEVTVEANPVQVELQTAVAKNVISGKQITELSLNARNYEQLVALMPGVTFTRHRRPDLRGQQQPAYRTIERRHFLHQRRTHRPERMDH